MGTILSFDERALDQLRERLGAAEEANQDLIAFARGHHGATVSIHRAVLSAIEAPSLERMVEIVVDGWPAMLGIDQSALAIIQGDHAILASRDGKGPVEAALVRKALSGIGAVKMRSVGRGHPLFGADSPAIRAEALVRLDPGTKSGGGLLLLGQTQSLRIEGHHGNELLQFLGKSLAAMIDRWLTAASN